MAMHARFVTNGNNYYTQELVIDGLTYPAGSYWKMTLTNTTTNTTYSMNSGSQGTSGNYRSDSATFSVQPGRSYSYTATAWYTSASSPVYHYTSGTTPSLPTPQPPGTPTVYLTSVVGRTITWRITPGARTTTLYIDRTWSTVLPTGTDGSTFYWDYVATKDGQFGIDVRGWNSDGYSGWSGYSYANVITAPPPLAWRTRYAGSVFDLTATEWNDMTAKINAWRQNRGLSVMSFSTAYRGNEMTAYIFNQIVDGINTLSPPTTTPAKVVVGEDVTAAKINRISTSIDSLK